MPSPNAALIGEFIRLHRERLSAPQVGLSFGLRRRAKGLRREEVASLCGISPTWLTWIEQGRATSVSAATLSRIATVLQLKRAERDYLFDLAGMHDPEQPEQIDNLALLATLRSAVERVQSPAYVLNRTWDVLAWNRHAADLFGAWLTPPATLEEGEEAAEDDVPPNLLRFMFLDDQARKLVVDWKVRAERLVAEFRADASAELEQEAMQAMVQELCGQSTDFDALWRRHDVLEREGGERAFHHPHYGALLYQQLTLRVSHAPDFKLVMLI
ncbi:MAG TPA: helix-turn-helix transcriptional regulator [Burkholderiaceae bacterium]